jgi:hypothetical protein
LAPIDVAAVGHGPAAAAAAAGRAGVVTRVRLVERSDGPVYLVSGLSGIQALRAADLADGSVRSEQMALAIAKDYARRRGLDARQRAAAALLAYDQWTVAGQYDPFRPLYRVAFNDGPGTELYVSSVTGEVVLETNHQQRAWNYVGSIAHWIYPAVLRSHRLTWNRLLWSISLLAVVAATIGCVIGFSRIRWESRRLVSPYRGWQAWHHYLGLMCSLFILSWIFSGWLSLDDGRLFSSGRPTNAEAAALAGTPSWETLTGDQEQHLSQSSKEVEWFAFGGQIYRRERSEVTRQRLVAADAAGDPADARSAGGTYLRPPAITAAVRRLGRACSPVLAVAADSDYPIGAAMPGAPVFRAVCGEDWFDIDGATGALLEKLDSSQRAYRWLYQALHTFDAPALTSRPRLRSFLIVVLCGCGFLFSVTGVVIAGRRVLLSVQSIR